MNIIIIISILVIFTAVILYLSIKEKYEKYTKENIVDNLANKFKNTSNQYPIGGLILCVFRDDFLKQILQQKTFTYKDTDNSIFYYLRSDLCSPTIITQPPTIIGLLLDPSGIWDIISSLTIQSSSELPDNFRKKHWSLWIDTIKHFYNIILNENIPYTYLQNEIVMYLYQNFKCWDYIHQNKTFIDNIIGLVVINSTCEEQIKNQSYCKVINTNRQINESINNISLFSEILHNQYGKKLPTFIYKLNTPSRENVKIALKNNNDFKNLFTLLETSL